MEPFIVTLVAVRAFGVDSANEILTEAVAQIADGDVPTNPAVQFMRVDPGGGGGPCAPEWIEQPIHVSPAGLPNPDAQSR
ncbi:MAG: hypothetical protein ACR2P5_05470 [Gammaproteobacteria bacterium]